ncbi:MAG: type I restriction-modification system subunit M [Anaerolineales bacterium]|nr:type I restriction-modification system subunit M [Anaerolineales bacterium]
MAIKKSELYSSLWKSADELRGGMDASQYKDYVLALLFVKYVSDKYAGQKHTLITVPPGGGFADMVAVKGQPDIGDKINKIIRKLADANELRGIIDVADFNDESKLGRGKERQDKLSNLVGIFENPALDFSRNRAEGDDLLGDAYEYLMRHFATESGKSKGQFYTPAEVSRVIAKVIGIGQARRPNQTLYDPTCGSGSLLLKASDEAPVKVSLYGQEMDNATAALAKMNMILHDNVTAEIWQDNTLARPHFVEGPGRLKTFDFVVANPPFSAKAWSTGFDPEHDEYGRFRYGVPPRKNGDYAFLLHVLASLKSTGTGAIIMPHGVLFRGNVEADIRQALVKQGFIKAIIGLPANLFYGTGIPACIIVLDKASAAGRAGIFVIDASQGFAKDGNKNRLRHQDLHKIVDVFARQLEIPKYSRMVPVAEIADPRNDYNLNIPRYIDSAPPEDRHDIEAHLKGGLPEADIEALGAYWEALPGLRRELFESAGRPGYSRLTLEAGQVRKVILGHPEFARFRDETRGLFEQWAGQAVPRLKAQAAGCRPKALIETLGEDLLRVFAGARLLDKYDVYQRLMNYWTETMQDDVYMVAVDGWQANPDLVPQELIVSRYFAKEQAEVDELRAAREAIAAQMEAMDEEQGGEDGVLYEAKTEKGKLTKVSVKARLKALVGEADVEDERQALMEYLGLIEALSEATARLGAAEKALWAKVTAKYAALTEAEVKALVVDDKWMTTLRGDVEGELGRVGQGLTGRVRTLAERYARPLPDLAAEVDELGQRVAGHLANMGYAWN